MRCDKYIVKPEQGVVVGTLYRNGCDGIYLETNYDAKHKLLNMFIELLIRRGLIEDIKDVPHPFKGVAKCQAPDEFSEKTGKQIVDIKTTYKYHVAMARKYRQLIRIFRKMVREAELLEQKHWKAAIKLDEKLESFM